MSGCNGCGGDCASCGGNCPSCGGCGGALFLTPGEIAMLRRLGQIPFLPIARRIDTVDPVYLEETDKSVTEYGLILMCLEKKGLISLDFDRPLAGVDDSAYAAYPIRGSMALTARGQSVLDLLELQGAQEEDM